MTIELISKDLDILVVNEVQNVQRKYSLVDLNAKKERLEKELIEINLLLNIK